jgi:predicted hydrocarbon binding protein
MSVHETDGIVAVANPGWAEAMLDGTACGFYGAALAELLRELTAFEGAMIHVSCGAKGDDCCRWQTGNNNGGE